MKPISQNDMENIIERVREGSLTVDQANVEMVRNQRVSLVGKLPASVRRALNEAVKRGELGHMKKDGHKPEAYFHPTFEYLAKAERAEHERQVKRALLSICC